MLNFRHDSKYPQLGPDSGSLDAIGYFEFKFMLSHLTDNGFADDGVGEIKLKLTRLFNWICLKCENTSNEDRNSDRIPQTLYQHVSATISAIDRQIEISELGNESRITHNKKLIQLNKTLLQERRWTPGSISLLQTFFRQLTVYFINMCRSNVQSGPSWGEVGVPTVRLAYEAFLEELHLLERAGSGSLRSNVFRQLYQQQSLIKGAALSAALGVFFANLPAFSWSWFIIALAIILMMGLRSRL